MTVSFDYAQARENMVEQQVRPWDVLDLRVLEVLSTLPREAFVAETHRTLAYADMALPIGHGEHMLKPVLEGRFLQALLVQPQETVLHVGAGSGYLTACLAKLGAQVTGVERHADLADAANARLQAQGIANARVVAADVLEWDDESLFDVVCVGAAVAEDIPAALLRRVRPGGRLLLVQGEAPAMEAVLIHRDGTALRRTSLFETDLPYLAGAEPAPRFAF